MRLLRTIIWKRLDVPGLEFFQFREAEDGFMLSGEVILQHPSGPASLSYSIRVDNSWTTREAMIHNAGTDRDTIVMIRRDEVGRWFRDDDELTELSECIDLDLSFSPSTNMIPIRRLQPDVGVSVSTRAAWLRFPDLTLATLQQSYKRVDARRYEYESETGFQTLIDVDELGIPLQYHSVWTT